MMIKMSPHASADRLDRMMYIVTEIGVGEPALSYVEVEYRRKITLTDTGVVLVQDERTEMLITAYVASIDRATAMWTRVYGDHARLPQYLYNKVVRNRKTHVREVNEINKTYGYKYGKRG
jgi:hypothetical protein